jgi:hypothetical protein
MFEELSKMKKTVIGIKPNCLDSGNNIFLVVG